MRNILFALLTLLFTTNCDAAAMRKIQFIVNPISGGMKGQNIEQIIEAHLDHHQFDYSIHYTQKANHASELTQEAIKKGIDIVVAVGGDGTVNEVGKALINTQTALAILPVGSGNGLAKHLGIPTNLSQALQALNLSEVFTIDTGLINDQIFLGTAGIGFDALVAWEFDHFGKRGFSSYFQIALREYLKYQPKSYILVVDGKKIQKNAFILSFANSSQYGNDFIIAPKASLKDSFLDLIVVKELPFFALPKIIERFKHGTLDQSKYVEILKCQHVVIKQKEIQAHIDGEPVLFHDRIDVRIRPASLKVMVPKQKVNV